MTRHGSGLKYELIGNYIYYRTNYLLYNNLHKRDENNMTTKSRRTYKRIVEIVSDSDEEFLNIDEKLGAIYGQVNKYMEEQE